jgi:hypothetical protein
VSPGRGVFCGGAGDRFWGVGNFSHVGARACQKKLRRHQGKPGEKLRALQGPRRIKPNLGIAPPLEVFLFSKLSVDAKKNNPAPSFFSTLAIRQLEKQVKAR